MRWSLDRSKTNTEQLRSAIDEADAVIVGAGAGLSTSAGFTYSGQRFDRYFGDFAVKYGFTDMYSGGFYPYRKLTEMWGFWCRNIYVNRYMDPPKNTYSKLLDILKGKDFFVITTNVDHCFQKAGIDKSRLFYTQGDYGLWQCQSGRIKKTYDNEEQVKKMLLAEGFRFEHASLDYHDDWGELIPPADRSGRTEWSSLKTEIPADMLPVCPDDGSPMKMNLRADETFVEDEGWHEASRRYFEFIEAHKTKKVLFLDLGSGGNTPVIFKIPFMRWTMDWPNAIYATINKGEAFTAREIADKSIVIDSDIDNILEFIDEKKEK